MKVFLIILLTFSAVNAQMSFENYINLSNTPWGNSDYEAVYADGPDFYITWEDNGEIFLKYSSDAGGSWSSNRPVSSTSANCGWPVIAASGGNVYTFYHAQDNNYHIRFQKSTDYGLSWSSAQVLSIQPTSITPQLAIRGDYIFAAWEERINTNYEIFYIMSSDRGNTWTDLQNISNTPESSRWVQIKEHEGIVYLSWLESPSYPDSDIYFSRSTNNGLTWETAQQLTNDALPQHRITMKILDNTIYIVSQDQYGINFDDIGFMKSTDLGDSWIAAHNITNNSGNSGFADMEISRASDGVHRLYLAWHDNTHSAPNYDNLDIYFKYSEDGGDSWSDLINLSENSENSYRGRIMKYETPGADSLFVAWYDYSSGDGEIYGSRGLFTLPVPVELEGFSSKVTGNKIELKWKTITEINNRGFSLTRSINDGMEKKIRFVEGPGTTTMETFYSFTDFAKTDGNYRYRLYQVDYDGTSKPVGDLTIEITTIPETMTLMQNYPNPFNPETVIEFYLARQGNIRLELFDILGSRVKTLADGFYDTGYHKVSLSAEGLGSGVYFYSLTDGKIKITRKLLLLE